MKASMKRSIAEYLPQKEPVHLIQVRLPVELVNETGKYLKAHRLTWKELMQACLENFRDNVIRGK